MSCSRTPAGSKSSSFRANLKTSNCQLGSWMRKDTPEEETRNNLWTLLKKLSQYFFKNKVSFSCIYWLSSIYIFSSSEKWVETAIGLKIFNRFKKTYNHFLICHRPTALTYLVNNTGHLSEEVQERTNKIIQPHQLNPTHKISLLSVMKDSSH